MNYKVVIWGADGENSLGLIREVGNSDLDVLFLINGASRGITTSSMYCKQFVETKNPQEGLEYLKNNYTDKENKAVLIPVSDNLAEIIDRHSSELMPFFHISGTKEKGLLSKILDKQIMSKLAEESGFSTPSTIEISTDIDLDKIEYPTVVKPARHFAGASFKCEVCNNRTELDLILKKINYNTNYIIQKFIQKEYDLLVYGCRLNNGKLLIAGIYHKDRFTDFNVGSATYGYISDVLPQCISVDAIEKFLVKIDYYGIFSVEYGYSKEVAYFYEFNLRNDGTSHLFYQCGANIPLAWTYNCLNIDKKIQSKVDKGNRYVIHELRDKINYSRKLISLKDWKKDKKRATVYYYYDKEDIRPYKNIVIKGKIKREIMFFLKRFLIKK